MKKKKNVFYLMGLILLIGVLALGLPAGGLYISAVATPHTYEESYYGALPLKYDHLREVTSPKIVVVGGSSVAFGVNSALVEQELGRPCVNFGLYAAFGLKPMLDLSLGSLSEGDVVVIAPELSSQMYSDYVGYKELLKSMEGRSDLAACLGTDYNRGFLANYLSFSNEAAKLRENGGAQNAGVYAKASFNERGDMIFKRESNVMDGGFLSDNLPEVSDKLVTDRFADMINEYIAGAKKRGAVVYFGFCPVNELSVKDVSKEDQAGLILALQEKLDCELIASLEDHIMDAGYFYDSNFHMNDAGCIANTVLLINDLKRVTGIGVENELSIKVPEAPALPGAGEAAISNGELGEITYSIYTSGVEITGVSASGESAEHIEIPAQIEGVAVTKIGERAFSKAGAVQDIVLPETITSLSGGLFADCGEQLVRVELHSSAIPEVGNHLFDDAPAAVKIYVKSELYGNYVTDYFWGQYDSRLESL